MRTDTEPSNYIYLHVYKSVCVNGKIGWKYSFAGFYNNIYIVLAFLLAEINLIEAKNESIVGDG